MDLLQLRDFCAACGLSLSKFVSKFENDLASADAGLDKDSAPGIHRENSFHR